MYNREIKTRFKSSCSFTIKIKINKQVVTKRIKNCRDVSWLNWSNYNNMQAEMKEEK